jgi:hypothetical protein
VSTGRLALTAVPAAAYVVVMAPVAALWVEPPLLGWIGVGIVVVVAAAVIERQHPLVVRGPAAITESG